MFEWRWCESVGRNRRLLPLSHPGDLLPSLSHRTGKEARSGGIEKPLVSRTSGFHLANLLGCCDYWALALAFFFLSAHRNFIISEMRLRAAALMVRRFLPEPTGRPGPRPDFPPSSARMAVSIRSRSLLRSDRILSISMYHLSALIGQDVSLAGSSIVWPSNNCTGLMSN